MKYPLLVFLGMLTASFAHASDTLLVSMAKNRFAKGDSIEFTCSIPGWAAKKLSTATLNVWIEDIQRNRRWKFRYPMLEGEVSASLAVGDKIPDGQYAVNFLVQRGFFRMTGELINPEKQDSLVNYMMIVKNKKGSYFDNARIARDGSFKLKSTLFEDSAYFVFSPAKKVKDNYLQVHIETPLDSVFVPVASATRFITVGKTVNPDEMTVVKDTAAYLFSAEEPVDKTLLPGVVVTAKIKKRIDQYNDENAKGLFAREDAMIFDGLDDEEIARSVSVFQFLQRKVPGITVERDSVGQEYARWRNDVVELYIDEFKMDNGDHTFISPRDIAMIKVYRPPAQISPMSSAGAIAIYTKKGADLAASRNRHNFIVKGYTSMDSVWK
ncbi:hypothetical protein [Sediminibacterium soli]|uniref:hypothetical protein n=1 Tax=Sediminibacterium soli TaxID=2698829 RepID=UPI00137AF5BB|nr:hypothetical protein [Sediminibacterium soli]NCI47804.1 hypothetical protein [Sediminibacterium soli]